jgi:hypothetical protein
MILIYPEPLPSASSNKSIMFKLIKLSCIAFALTLGLACGHTHSHSHSDDHDHSHGTEANGSPSHQGKEYSSAYICPMHCEGSGSDEPGTCPACGMDYVVNDKATKE